MKCPTCRAENLETAHFCLDCGARLDGVSFTKTLETPSGELVRGTDFAGRYEIIEELGAGGMGRVYRAYDKKIEEEVALKLIRPEIAAEKRTVERFRNELKTARKIRHANVCAMFDLQEEGRALFITMEYVRGEDLKSLIRRTKQLAPGTAVSIARQVAEGLGEAHRLGVVHRDLKPGNIMIDKEGSAKIMDFGIARSLLRVGTTAEGAVIGTPEYMSPEQVEGKPADVRADIYALGVILFEMVTGRPPFEGETALAVAHKHKYEPAPDPRTLNPQLPVALGRLILRSMEKEREKRYQTAAELLADLEAVEALLPSTDRAPVRTPSKTKPPTSKTITVKIIPKKIVLLAFGMVALIAAGILVFSLLKPGGFTPPPTVENSVAVISFENQTGDKSNDYMCRRVIPDTLIVNLENAGLFALVPTWERMEDILKQMGKKDANFIDYELGFEIARRLGIKTVVSGSVNKTGETYNILVRIQDTKSRRSVGSLRSEGGGADSILKTQIDELSRGICEALGTSLDGIVPGKLNIGGVTTSSMEAYEYYLKGVERMEKYQWEEAGEYFKKAIHIDPSFAAAYRRLGGAYNSQGNVKERAAANAKAKEFSAHASEMEKLRIDAQYALYQEDMETYLRKMEEISIRWPMDKDAHYWLGFYLVRPSTGKLRNVERGIKELENVLTIDPDYVDAYNSLGFSHSELGNLDKAEDYLNRYASLSPGNANPFDSLGNFYFGRRGESDKAIRSFNKALEISPDFYMSNYGLTYTFAFKENYAKALDAITRYVEGNPPPRRFARACFLKAFLLLWLGRYEEAFREAGAMEAAGKEGGVADILYQTEYLRGIVSFLRGDFDAIGGYFGKAKEAAINNFDPARALRAEIDINYALGWLDLAQGRLEAGQSKLAQIQAVLPIVPDGPEKEKSQYLRDILAVELDILGETTVSDEVLDRIQEYSLNLAFPSFQIITDGIDLHFPPPLIRDVLPRYYLRKGGLDRAIAAYESLVTFNPKSKDRRLIHPLSYYRLAMAYEQKGIIKKTKANYRKFLKLWKDADPGLPEVEDAKKRLAALD